LSLRVVVDTNVVVSGLLKSEGSPARVLDLVRDLDAATLLIDDRIFEEYREVLARPKFQRAIAPTETEAFLAYCSSFGEHVAAARIEAVYPDPDDAPFLEVAVAGRADALVTGNVKHFPTRSGLRVLAPVEFLEFARILVRRPRS
jgi:putative PIN family toxin of toxin-antitoxin system